MPAHIVSDPSNIASRDDDNDDDDDRFGEAKTAEDATAGADDDEVEAREDEAERRRVHKGKSVVNVSDQVLAVVRLSNTARDLRLDVGKDESVRSIIHHIMEENNVSGTRPTQLLVRPAGLSLTSILMKSVSPCSAPFWLPCSPRTHGQNPKREHFPHGSGMDGPGHQRFRV